MPTPQLTLEKIHFLMYPEDKDEIILATVEHVLAIVENVSFSEDVEKIQDELTKLKKEEDDLIKRIESQPVETVVLRKKEKLPKRLRNGWK